MRGSQGVRDLISTVRSRNMAHIIFCARWLPPVCSQAKVIRPDGTEGGNTSKLRLDLCQWQLAWDRHMIGAIVVGQVGRFTYLSQALFSLFVLRMQMSMSTAIKHKHNVMSIAERGVAHGRKEFLGVLYDELARWAHLWAVSMRARDLTYLFNANRVGRSLRKNGQAFQNR